MSSQSYLPHCDPILPAPLLHDIKEDLTANKINVCKHWAKKGMCRYDDRCSFLHPPALRGFDASFAKKKNRPKANKTAQMAMALCDPRLQGTNPSIHPAQFGQPQRQKTDDHIEWSQLLSILYQLAESQDQSPHTSQIDGKNRIAFNRPAKQAAPIPSTTDHNGSLGGQSVISPDSQLTDANAADPCYINALEKLYAEAQAATELEERSAYWAAAEALLRCIKLKKTAADRSRTQYHSRY